LLRIDAPGAKLDSAFVEALTSSEANVRIIICAPTLIDAIHLIGESLAAGAYRVEIPALRTRSGEIASLFDRWFIDRQSRYRFSDFEDKHQAALRAYRWPENLEELRDVADTLTQLAPYASSRKAEDAGVMPKTNINRWLTKYGVSMPLLRDSAK
jgi:transcriptional regulator of acetoin/glycerol metabolism